MSYINAINKDKLIDKTVDDCIFFYGHSNANKLACFSNWYISQFKVRNIPFIFHNTEQYLMFMKAKLFEDTDIGLEIAKEHDPRKVKKLGRKVSNFKQDVWDDAKYDIMCDGLYHKFNSHNYLKACLLKTNDKIIVEASPSDSIWGIGMSIDTAMNSDIKDWRGNNLLGYALMDVRDKIRNEEFINEFNNSSNKYAVKVKRNIKQFGKGTKIPVGKDLGVTLDANMNIRIWDHGMGTVEIHKCDYDIIEYSEDSIQGNNSDDGKIELTDIDLELIYNMLDMASNEISNNSCTDLDSSMSSLIPLSSIYKDCYDEYDGTYVEPHNYNVMDMYSDIIKKMIIQLRS
jgi:ribA/ribD-fused uncharacterized protein